MDKTRTENIWRRLLTIAQPPHKLVDFTDFLEKASSLHWAGDIAILARARAKMGDESNFNRIQEVENIPKSQPSHKRRQIRESLNSYNRNNAGNRHQVSKQMNITTIWCE